MYATDCDVCNEEACLDDSAHCGAALVLDVFCRATEGAWFCDGIGSLAWLGRFTFFGGDEAAFDLGKG
jgi:hypothetical protein